MSEFIWRNISPNDKRRAAELVAENLDIEKTPESLAEIERIGKIGAMYHVAMNHVLRFYPKEKEGP